MLLRRMYPVLPTFTMSLGLLLGWQREEIALRNACAREALAVDDPLEELDRDIDAALANDPAPVRARVRRALRETHRRTEELSSRLQVEVRPEVLAPLPGEETTA